MSIKIDREICIGCGKCVTVCPGSLIRLDNEKKAYMKYPKDCWACTSCIKECPTNACKLYLGADMGGMGSLVHVKTKGDILHWITEKSNGEIIDIPINKRESNKY